MDNYHGQVTTATTTPRMGTPDSERIEPIGQRVNPFASPYGSMPASAMGSTTAFQQMPPARYFHSRRIEKGSIEKPWLEKKDPKEKWVTIIPLIGILLGFGLAGFLVYEGLSTVTNYNYCTVLDENWSNGIDPTIWTQEQQTGGFGYVLLLHSSLAIIANFTFAVTASSKSPPPTTRTPSLRTACSLSSLPCRMRTWSRRMVA